MIRVRLMTFEDMELGLRLRQQAGWNQTPADWARFLTHQPHGCFVAEHDGVPCGTATTWHFGEVAWIAMMLVDQERRGVGIGRALMEHALGYLEARKTRTIRLDATTLGEPLYRKLGFEAQYELGRFAGQPAHLPKSSEPVELIVPEAEWPPCASLDRIVTSTDRHSFLFPLFAERPAELHVVRRGGAIVGYLTARRGALAWQIGPCIATAEAGATLLSDALCRLEGRQVFIDLPLTHQPALALAARAGLSRRRTLLRMCRGEPVIERVDQMWASSGPEKG
jgi:GNAT superfamily N-acetyltransferase